ncbi:threonine aldolase family protein [Sediminitomix flava]|uniref:L-threonine aldolase n=1 Tax=Sediminitomix flava TaxID=379075 RepID=A0A316A3J1_SEDFL|nr:low specificity L-threonine aldolase [Sediminitomix flava]PWJ44297.1 L-threonine aldolase [Sediminitomix flava]
MKSFASDNYAGVSPEVMEAMVMANVGHAPAYGNDELTQLAKDKIKALFKTDPRVFFVMNGTGANVTALKTFCRSHETVVCADVAHINTDECGAPEHHLGGKLTYIKTEDGKITPEQIKPLLSIKGVQHRVQPKVVSITQPTEFGVLYSTEEIQSLSAFCKENELILHVDGARIANAVVALDTPVHEMLKGVDIISFGGTKNGMMMGESVVFQNKELADYYPFIRKQSMQLLSKMRYISAQFDAYLTNDLWKKNATHANKMAQHLAEGLKEFDQIKITHSVDVNGIFAELPTDLIPVLQEKYPFYIFDESRNLARLMCSFDTTTEDIQGFLELIHQHYAN